MHKTWKNLFIPHTEYLEPYQKADHPQVWRTDQMQKICSTIAYKINQAFANAYTLKVNPADHPSRPEDKTQTQDQGLLLSNNFYFVED